MKTCLDANRFICGKYIIELDMYGIAISKTHVVSILTLYVDNIELCKYMYYNQNECACLSVVLQQYFIPILPMSSIFHSCIKKQVCTSAIFKYM